VSKGWKSWWKFIKEGIVKVYQRKKFCERVEEFIKEDFIRKFKVFATFSLRLC
jgi:hypothetical protein